MQTVSAQLIKGKTVLLRLDIDVPVKNGRVLDDFRLKSGLPTLKLCLENAEEVIIMGHVGRPGGKEVSELSVEPIYDWLENQGFQGVLGNGKLKLLENLRFEAGEEACDLEYAKELASYGDFYVNEAFASHHKAASTTVLPALLPHAAGLRFAEEVKRLTEVRNPPAGGSKRPLVVIIGGVKIEDKEPAIKAMSRIADHVLVGGKIALEFRQTYHDRYINVRTANLNEEGADIDEETVKEWEEVIKKARMVVWNGPLGQIQNSKFKIQNLGTEKGTYDIAKTIAESNAESIIGGGDTISALSKMGFLSKFNFVSVGGGAMLKFLTEGTLPAIEALKLTGQPSQCFTNIICI